MEKLAEELTPTKKIIIIIIDLHLMQAAVLHHDQQIEYENGGLIVWTRKFSPSSIDATLFEENWKMPRKRLVSIKKCAKLKRFKLTRSPLY